ncbi:3-oxoacyl-[acyl-carrier-protein] reductase FabG-like [Salvia hispanica]|uniref:3-oxoacyl-[acyl-carrier-protein] reductase FabG-like n=1 Tax=Salvia hispanica TaxID=49212 RepID=UPI0020098225|nr:3-oxoacyl-[acyl-carrier-protein] reductase FabG-like [Salvia hispanica]
MEAWAELRDKVVLVTGASSGLGREYCLDLAKAGCRIVAAARRTERLLSLCDEIGGGRAVAVELDVQGSGDTIEAAVNKAWDAFGRIDALINNAGVRGEVHSPLELSEDEWDHLFRTNVKGTWLVSKYVCRRMRDCGRGGSVINISSITGLDRGQLPGGLAYVASKSALNATTKVMALELGEYKIRVNSISPGLFKSEITEGLMVKDWLNNVATKTVPLGTFGESNPALTSLVRYLIHDSSQYITGNIFIVDAGVTLPGFPIFSSL